MTMMTKFADQLFDELIPEHGGRGRNRDLAPGPELHQPARGTRPSSARPGTHRSGMMVHGGLL